MALSREEVDQIGTSVAQKVVDKVYRKPCDCGLSIWERGPDFDAVEEDINERSYEHFEDDVSDMVIAIGLIEASCGINLDNARLNTEELLGFGKTRNWEKAGRAIETIEDNIGDALALCAGVPKLEAVEDGFPGNHNGRGRAKLPKGAW